MNAIWPIWAQYERDVSAVWARFERGVSAVWARCERGVSSSRSYCAQIKRFQNLKSMLDVLHILYISRSYCAHTVLTPHSDRAHRAQIALIPRSERDLSAIWARFERGMSAMSAVWARSHRAHAISGHWARYERDLSAVWARFERVFSLALFFHFAMTRYSDEFRYKIPQLPNGELFGVNNEAWHKEKYKLHSVLCHVKVGVSIEANFSRKLASAKVTTVVNAVNK